MISFLIVNPSIPFLFLSSASIVLRRRDVPRDPISLNIQQYILVNLVPTRASSIMDDVIEGINLSNYRLSGKSLVSFYVKKFATNQQHFHCGFLFFFFSKLLFCSFDFRCRHHSIDCRSELRYQERKKRKEKWRRPITYPHDLDKEKNVDEKYDDCRRHVDPVVTVGRHPRTAGQERLQVQFLLYKRHTQRGNTTVYRFNN